MAAQGATDIVTSQPRSRRKEVEGFVRDLDPLQVSGTPELLTFNTTVPIL
jgi:hypothetical protein